MASSSGGTYASSQEKTNFARMCRIVVDVLRDILWQVLIHEIPPADLPNRVRMNQNKLGNLDVKIKTWLCVISFSSSDIPIAEKFDVTSLYTLIRNLCRQVPAPSTQWGQPPPQGGTTLGDDIERVREFRNTLYGHATRAEIDTGDFNNLCTDIKSSVSRFDAFFSSNCTGMKSDFINEIDTILTCSMDKCLQDLYIKKMKDIADLFDDLHDTINQHDSDVKEEFLNLNKKVDDVMTDLKEKAEGIAEIKEILQKQDVVERGDSLIQMMPSFEVMSPVRTFSTDEINGAWQSIEQYLLKDLAPKNIVPYLEKLNIFSDEEWKSIRVLRRKKIAERILKRIKEKLPDAFNSLLSVLNANKQEVIIENLIKVIEQPSPPEIIEPVSPESSYTLTFNVRKGGNTVSEVELKIATLLKAAVMLFAFELLSKVVEILLGSVTIHLQPLSNHAKDTLEFFCKHDGMKTFVLDLLKKKDIFSCLPEGNICIQIKVCCYDGDATSEDGNFTDFTKMSEEILSKSLESFEVLNEPHVIRQNLLFQFGYIVEEIEPLQFQDTFIGKGIWDTKFFDQLKAIKGRRERAVKFLDEVVNKDNTILLALVDALKNNGDEDLACSLCFVAKQSQENKDWVDDSFLEVLTVVPETCTEGELWSCYLEVSKRKNVDAGDDIAIEVVQSDEQRYPMSAEGSQMEHIIEPYSEGEGDDREELAQMEHLIEPYSEDGGEDKDPQEIPGSVKTKYQIIPEDAQIEIKLVQYPVHGWLVWLGQRLARLGLFLLVVGLAVGFVWLLFWLDKQEIVRQIVRRILQGIFWKVVPINVGAVVLETESAWELSSIALKWLGWLVVVVVVVGIVAVVGLLVLVVWRKIWRKIWQKAAQLGFEKRRQRRREMKDALLEIENERQNAEIVRKLIGKTSYLPPSLRDNKLSEKELGRISMNVGRNIYDLGIALGLSHGDIQQIQSEYPYKITQCLMMLFKWKLHGEHKATFRNLEKAFVDADVHVEILKLVNTTLDSVSCLPPKMTGKQPGDRHLSQISRNIGALHVHVGVELEVPLSRILQILQKHPGDLQIQFVEIMKEWRLRQAEQATFRNLELAFNCIGIDTNILKQCTN